MDPRERDADGYADGGEPVDSPSKDNSSVDGPKSVLHILKRGGLATSRILLRDEGSSDAPLVNTRSVKRRAATEARYQVLGEIARGGVGVVLKGRDQDLGRDVAMKVLLEEFAHNPDVAQRFVDEAQIGGQLQHPGIVPVYEMGVQKDGRPYFTMKLVKGRTLAALLADRRSPSDDLRRFLRIFASVCQTLSYAHSRKVAHRDVKPANVMVGTHGENLLVDWGLAKVGDVASPAASATSDKAPQTVIETLRSATGVSPSLTGSVMGTPGYMAPEQARGELDCVDQRSDVFSLGAVLCEILTGEPPFLGDVREAIVATARADLRDAHERLDASGADPELIELAKWCMAPARAARPQHAGSVADEISSYLASVDDRERSALDDEDAARVQVEADRKSRRLTTLLAVAVGIVIVAGVGAYGYVRHESVSRRERAGRLADEALRETTLLVGRASADETSDSWARAVDSAKRARALATGEDVDPSFARRAERLLADVEEGARTAADAVEARAKDAEMARRLDDLRAAALIGVGDSVQAGYQEVFEGFGLGPHLDRDAQIQRIMRTSIWQRLAAELAIWARELRGEGATRDELHQLMGLCDADAWRRSLREAATREELLAVAGERAPHEMTVDEMLELAAALEDAGEVYQAGELFAAARRQFPGDPWAALALGLYLRRVPIPPESPYGSSGPAVVQGRLMVSAFGEEVPPSAGWLGFSKPDALDRIRELVDRNGSVVHSVFLRRPSPFLATFLLLHEDGTARRLSVAVARTPPHAPLGWRHESRTWEPEPFGAASALTSHLALPHLSAAAALRPDLPLLRVALADALLDELRVERARALLDPIRELGVGAHLLALARARLAFVQGDTDAARTRLQEALDAAPDAALAHCRLGWLALESGDFESAMARFETARSAAAADPSWRWPVDDWELLATECSALVDNAIAFADGSYDTDDLHELGILARICDARGLPAAASRLYSRYVTYEASRNDDRVTTYEDRYRGVRAAARAAANTGDPAEQAEHRERLLRRLGRLIATSRAYMAVTTSEIHPLHEVVSVQTRTRMWLLDPLLAPVRSEGAIQRLPEAERDAWRHLWEEVRELADDARSALR